MRKRILFYEVPAGYTISKAAKDMAYEAAVENAPVVSLFNDIKLTAHPQSSQSEIEDDYYAKMVERRRRAGEGESRAENQIRAIRKTLALGQEE
jgi:hypothetical protein